MQREIEFSIQPFIKLVFRYHVTISLYQGNLFSHTTVTIYLDTQFVDIIKCLPNLFMEEGSKLHILFFARIDYD